MLYVSALFLQLAAPFLAVPWLESLLRGFLYEAGRVHEKAVNKGVVCTTTETCDFCAYLKNKMQQCNSLTESEIDNPKSPDMPSIHDICRTVICATIPDIEVAVNYKLFKVLPSSEISFI